MNVSYIILLFILIVIVLNVYYKAGKFDMVYVRSDLDGNTYMVRNGEDKKLAANLLAKIRININILDSYMHKKIGNNNEAHPKYHIYREFEPYIIRLHDKIKYVVIKESSENNVYTSYTINKGEQIVFCIRSKAISNIINSSNIHDINLIMYVALHEISHIACPEYDHTPLFKKIFRFICGEAIEIGIYRHIDFRSNPHEYCGMKINDSII